MVGMAEAGLRLGLLTAGMSVAGLAATGLVVWRRTAGLRSPRLEAAGLAARPAVCGRSSRTTWIAAGGGGGVALAGVAMTVGRVGSGLGGAAVVLAGVLVIGTGLRDRVVELAADERALLVRRARRPATRLAWSEILALRGPRTPLGGWRVLAGKGSATLMPSDVLGHEWVLRETVLRAGLVRCRRGWVRASG
jgi:hypothetical protein